MRHAALVAFLMFARLSGVEWKDLQRSEDWELQLTEANRLAKAQQFDAAESLYSTLTEAAYKFDFPLLLKAKCLNNHASLLHQRGQFAGAEKKYKEAATFWIAATGAESDEHATTLNNLGEVYRLLGRYTDAESMFRKAVSIRESLMGRDKLRLASALNNLGTTQLQKFRAGATNGIGTSNSVASLGETQRAQQQFAEADANLQRALQIKKEILGANHPDVATSINNLAALRQDAGDPAGAEKLYLEALAIREAQSPADRPALASVLNNLGTLHRKTRRMASAEQYISRANQLWEEALGPHHPSLAAGLNNLAELLLTTDRPAEAEPLFRRAISIQEVHFGPDHPVTATALDNLGTLFLRLDKAPGAETLFRRAMDARAARFGRDSALALESMHHLGQSLYAQGRHTEAERVLVDELSILEQKRMHRTSQHGSALSDLALIQFAQRRLDAGEKYLNEVATFADQLPAHQQEVVSQLYGAYARLLRSAKRNRDAERMEGKAKSFLPR